MMNLNSCILELEKFIQHIHQIESNFDLQTSRIKPQNIAQARELFQNLRLDLEQAYRLRSTNLGEARMSEIESAFFYPAVHEAFANLTVRANSIPDEKWLHELGDMEFTLNYYLSGLRSALKQAV